MSITIFEDKKSYAEALEQAKSKRKVFNELLTEAKKYISIDEKNKKEIREFKEHPFKYFRQAFLQKHKENNTLQLSFDKLTYVLEINTTDISLLSDKYLKLQEWSEDPQEQDFVQLATTPEQIRRYEIAKKVCDSLMELKRIAPSHSVNMTTLMCGAGQCIQIDYGNNILIPNPYWIINGNR
jgi:hypothetical protein